MSAYANMTEAYANMTENKSVEEILNDYREIIGYLNTIVYPDLDEDGILEYYDIQDKFWVISEYVMVHGTEEDKQTATEWASDCDKVWNGERWADTEETLNAFEEALNALTQFNDDHDEDLFAELMAHANGEPEPETDNEDADSDDE